MDDITELWERACVIAEASRAAFEEMRQMTAGRDRAETLAEAHFKAESIQRPVTVGRVTVYPIGSRPMDAA